MDTALHVSQQRIAANMVKVVNFSHKSALPARPASLIRQNMVVPYAVQTQNNKASMCKVTNEETILLFVIEDTKFL